MIFILSLLLSVAVSAISEQNVYRAAFETGALLLNEPDEDQAPKSCENDCAKALEVEMVMQGISFDENLLSALNDSTKFDSICSFYNRQLTTCFPKCAQKPANSIVALLQLICVDKHQALAKNIGCAAQMESAMTEVCVNNCLRRKHSAESDSPIMLQQQDACTRSHCVIKCLGAQITECDLTEMKGVYDLLSGAQMLMGFQKESAPELTAQRLRSTAVPAKCRLLMQASHASMRNVVIPQTNEDDISDEAIEMENIKKQKVMEVLGMDQEKKLDAEMEKVPLE